MANTTQSSILKIQRTIPVGELTADGGLIFANSFSTIDELTIVENELNIPLNTEYIDLSASFNGITSGTAYLVAKVGVAGSNTPPADLNGWKLIGNESSINADGKAQFNNIPVTEYGSGFAFAVFTYTGSANIVSNSNKKIS